jgi:hypothetical protein
MQGRDWIGPSRELSILVNKNDTLLYGLIIDFKDGRYFFNDRRVISVE